MPCLECTQPRYCSERCRADSWDGYHRHECGALDLLDSAGVAHLALRAVLVAASSSARPRGGGAAAAAADAIRELRPFADRRTLALPKNSNVAGVKGFLLPRWEIATCCARFKYFNCFPGDYGRILNLVEHSSSCDPDDLFQYTLTAVLLTVYLRQRTKFFSSSPGGRTLSTSSTSSLEEEESEELSTFVSALLLKHILQLVCNASAVFDVLPESQVKKFTK